MGVDMDMDIYIYGYRYGCRLRFGSFYKVGVPLEGGLGLL